MRNVVSYKWSAGRAATMVVVAQAIMVVVCLDKSPASCAASGVLDLQQRMDRLEVRFRTELDGWRAHVGDVPGAERPDYDDGSWDKVNIGFQWDIPNSICWFRRWIDVPKEVGGVPVDGVRLALRLSIDNGGAIVFV